MHEVISSSLTVPTKKRTPFRVFFLWAVRRELRAPNGRTNRKRNYPRVVRARAAPDALPRGPRLRGFGKYLPSPPKKGHPFGCLFLWAVRRELRAPNGRTNRKRNYPRVVRARAAPDALPRGPRLRGFGKYLPSPPEKRHPFGCLFQFRIDTDRPIC